MKIVLGALLFLLLLGALEIPFAAYHEGRRRTHKWRVHFVFHLDRENKIDWLWLV